MYQEFIKDINNTISFSTITAKKDNATWYSETVKILDLRDQCERTMQGNLKG